MSTIIADVSTTPAGEAPLAHAASALTPRQRVKAIVQQRLPKAFVSASHELSQEYREFERCSTVVANAYVGPRVESFRASVAMDAEPLRALTAGRPLVPGDFEFSPDAAGPRYDAFLKLGPASFLVCNHTAKAMAEIRADPRWLKAQKVFFELSEKFRADPLTEERSR